MKVFQKIIIFSLVIITTHEGNAQFNEQVFFGIGVGFDYGGFGIRTEYQPVKYMGIFGGLGYNLSDPSFNVGVSFKILPDKMVIPVVTAMYGYNGVIKVPYQGDTYYGFTPGIGCEINRKEIKITSISYYLSL